MSYLISEIDEHLIGLSHGATLNKVRQKFAMYKRASSIFLQKCKPIETIRTAALTSTIHDDVYTYGLPIDFNSLIDLIPQDNRNTWDKAFRRPAGQFDLLKAVKQKTISIEGSEGSKIIRINWRTRQGKVLHSMNSVMDNGTWIAVGSATGIVANDIFKVSGSASIEFDLVASGDGISNIGMTAVDLTDEDEVADVFVWMYFGTVPTSVTGIWGNDITTAFWTSVAQTLQADGSAFKVGWNLLKFPWGTATETGTVTPATIDSFKITVAASAAINNLRVDNIVFSIGRNFDIKYYSKYLFKNSAGTYITKPTDDGDTVLVDDDSLPIFLFELLEAAAHQMEGVDSSFDLAFAENQLKTLYPIFRSEHPDQRVKMAGRYGSGPRWSNRRF